MSALVVKVKIKAEFRDQFMKEMMADAIGSEKIEPGCLMFNIVNDAADSNTLYLFEVYLCLNLTLKIKRSGNNTDCQNSHIPCD